ncbi:hypothetical protein GOV06_02905 [Candidatus Woesearchaeota archaeon]|nr:hypothetical protein [Candidatus Woesearchaeota archaeon]
MMLSQLEIRRQLFHLVNGLIVVGLIYFDIFNEIFAIVLLLGYLIISLAMKKYRIPVFYSLFEYLDRPKDFKKLPGKGGLFYIIGIVLAFFLFPKDIAMASIIILALGDSLAPVFGQYGSIENWWNKKKYVEGSIGGGVIAFIGALLFVGLPEAGFGAAAAMFAEGIDLKLGVNRLDDNIIMPLVAGAVMLAVRYLI